MREITHFGALDQLCLATCRGRQRARFRNMTRQSVFLCGALICSLGMSAIPGGAMDPALKDLVRKKLSEPAEVQGYPCAEGYAWFFADGALRECAVSRPITFGETAIPQESWINLTHDGHPDFVFLAHDTHIGGYVCKGGGPLGPTEGAMTALYPGGKLKVCWLAEDTVVEGVPCVHASMLGDLFGGGSGTEFHESGRLQACKLSRDFTMAGHALRKGDHIHLTSAGRLVLKP